MVVLEFAWNIQKNMMSAVKGLEKEQNREGKISNPEIDSTKTHLNYDLVQSDLNLYQRIKQRVEEVKPVSRVQKNSIVDCSNIITVPQEQYKEWGAEKSKEYLKEVYNYFCKEFGKENVLSAKVHLDETTPHMHLHFVPVSLEGKLQARSVITRERLNKVHDEAPKYLQELGFDVERGNGKTTNSVEIKEYKAKKLKEEIDEVNKKLKNAQNISAELSKIESHSKALLDKLDKIEVKKALLSDKLTISQEDYSILRQLAAQGESKIVENFKLKNKVAALEKKLDEKSLDEENINVQLSKLNDIELEHYKLERKYKNINIAYNRLEKAVENLKLTEPVKKEMRDMKRRAERNKGIER